MAIALNNQFYLNQIVYFSNEAYQVVIVSYDGKHILYKLSKLRNWGVGGPDSIHMSENELIDVIATSNDAETEKKAIAQRRRDVLAATPIKPTPVPGTITVE